MPAALIPLISAGVGAAGSIGGGKKQNKAAQKQLDAQQQQLQFGKDVFNTGQAQQAPASDYWKAILSGDVNKMTQATGPTADLLKQQSTANARTLSATMPQGGEANAAQAGNQAAGYNNIARLYAGQQGNAAGQLGQLAGQTMGAGANLMGQGRPDVGGALNTQQNIASNKGAAGHGIGQGLGSLLQGKHSQDPSGGGGKSGGSGGSGVTPFSPN